MTCIVGLQSNGRVWLGGDSAGLRNWNLTVRADEKVFVVGQYAMGFTNSFRAGNVLRYRFKPPKPPSKNLMRFMVNDFVDSLRESLKDAGCATKSDEVESGAEFLVGVRGRLFTVFEDYQVARSANFYDAVGCGHNIAKGALFATRRSRMRPNVRVRLALEAAERFSGGVRRPFRVVKI